MVEERKNMEENYGNLSRNRKNEKLKRNIKNCNFFSYSFA